MSLVSDLRRQLRLALVAGCTLASVAHAQLIPVDDDVLDFLCDWLCHIGSVAGSFRSLFARRPCLSAFIASMGAQVKLKLPRPAA